MKEHTPGPWYVGSDEAVDCPDHHGSGLAMVETGRSADWPIARLCEWNNVRLIAAAPDLLDALEMLLDRMTDGRTEMSNGELEENADLIRAALAKVKA